MINKVHKQMREQMIVNGRIRVKIIITFRYILCEIIHPNGQEKRVPTERELYSAIFEELQEMHGDYGTASTTDAPPIRGLTPRF